MKISVINYPLYKIPYLRKKKFNGGPYIFLRRLTDQFENTNNINLKFTSKNSDIHLSMGGKKINYKLNYVLRLDGMFIDSKDNNRLLKNKILKESILNANGLIFISKFCKDLCNSIFDIKFPLQTVINNGVPLKNFSKIGPNNRAIAGFKAEDFVIVSSARWRRHKRLKELIEFFYLIKRYNKSFNFKLLILGKTNNLYNSFSDNDVFFTGDIDNKDLPMWFRSANAYINMAWIEPAGNTHLEAIATGLPVLTVNNGGLKETVLETKSGIVSNADKKYNYELVDYYNPPKPDYRILLNDFKKLLNQYDSIRNNIHLDSIDIKNVSKKYSNFFEKCK